MLDTAKSLKGYRLQGKDGSLGKVEEFYFDDKHWAVRYLVADTGGWLSGRQVLIAPHALGTVDRQARAILVHLTKKQIEGSPSLDTDKPISKQFQESYYSYYGWPIYWSGISMWGVSPYLIPEPRKSPVMAEKHDAWDPHLRSTRHVTGFTVAAKDGEIGHIEDFVIDDESWAIRYLVVATHDWWPGKKVLVSPKWIERITWDPMGTMKVNLSRDALKSSPEYTDVSLLTRDHEKELHLHYKVPEYWAKEKPAQSPR
jgi:uncharacterized protein YrrD